jgi:hypothetical protein
MPTRCREVVHHAVASRSGLRRNCSRCDNGDRDPICDDGMERWLASVESAGAARDVGYVNAGSLPFSLVLFAAADLPTAFLWARESYRARSLWPAVFFHSLHNSISQWLFPKFFAGGENERWLGEGGLLPVAGYVLLGLAIFVWTRRGPSWRVLSCGAFTNQTTEQAAWQ